MKVERNELKWHDLINNIEEKILTSKEDVKENKDFPNSYGAGFDVGYLSALINIKDLINEILSKENKNA